MGARGPLVVVALGVGVVGAVALLSELKLEDAEGLSIEVGESVALLPKLEEAVVLSPKLGREDAVILTPELGAGVALLPKLAEAVTLPPKLGGVSKCR